jgi:anti-anti-sigma factor
MPIEKKQVEPGMAVVAVSGRLVLGRELERLESVVTELVGQAQKKIVLDVTALDYADSSGVGVLVSCVTHVKKAGGELRIAGANPRMQRLFQVTGVDKILLQYPTVAEAAAG